ncbi:superoxide dismutase family protein [Streptomyces crystallinus]|uniref:Superoxide dismutase n=1 Tax=Streptomyces crystallinus TaxID=68191 RepID=A0ABN1FRT0_9ACTN
MRIGHAIGAASAAAALSFSFAAQPAAAADSLEAGVITGFDAATGPGLPRAVTYDQAKMPLGAKVTFKERSANAGASQFELSLEGALPGHTYGVHAHRLPCGANPDDSGAHYQNVPDPRQPSTDPVYANPANEVWLDLTTDATGAGKSATQVAWQIRPDEARSLVFHEQATATDAGRAGTAGARVACVSVRFAPVFGAVSWPRPWPPLASLHD